jgi:GT2 family glycosyltransferase
VTGEDVAASAGPGAVERIGVVAIGRNEGERLRRCIESLVGRARWVVYVDSGSSDGSVAMARAKGAEVAELDMSIPFTAARARNEGFARLAQLAPQLEYVQFVDGDCEVVAGWLENAAAFLDQHPDIGAVGGRRSERHPERSVYNLLCNIDWYAQPGDARFCGGDVLMRTQAFRDVGGYNAALIAGEDPEIYVRLRAAGWRLWRLDRGMTLHDAAMLRFGQWWKRTVRTGFAYAQGAALHGAPPESYGRRELRSAQVWGLGIPLVIVVLALLATPWALLLLLVYPLQVARLALRGQLTPRENWWRALFLIIGKFPELLGQLRFRSQRRRGRVPGLIEYK